MPPHVLPVQWREEGERVPTNSARKCCHIKVAVAMRKTCFNPKLVQNNFYLGTPRHLAQIRVKASSTVQEV